MLLQPTFPFSQSSLQDYLTCARRFELRYLRQMAWPAVESEPIEERERLAGLGTDFHRLVHQHLLGLGAAELAAGISDDVLGEWWQRFLAYRPAELGAAGAQILPEITLTAGLDRFRLLAKMDVLVLGPDGDFLIIDWKTSPRRPSAEALQARVQTRLYRYVLVAGGAQFNQGQPVDPARVTMLYWFTADPAGAARFPYSAAQFEADRAFLQATLAEIEARAQAETFPLTPDLKHCQYCVYRSYCDRGERAGPLDADQAAPEVEEAEALSDLLLDWGQVQEIAY